MSLPWIIRALIGMVSSMTFSASPAIFEAFIAVTPLSDRARLIERVKFRGVVVGSRRSEVRLAERSELDDDFKISQETSNIKQ